WRSHALTVPGPTDRGNAGRERRRLTFCGFLLCAALERRDFLRFFAREFFTSGLFGGTFGGALALGRLRLDGARGLFTRRAAVRDGREQDGQRQRKPAPRMT